MLIATFMAIKRTIIEEDPNESDPTVVRTTKRVVNPDIHTPIVDAHEEVVNDPNSTTVKHTKIVQEPLVEADHPQHVYETNKTIFQSEQIIWYLLAVIEVILGLRMVFKAIGANPYSGFVSLIYTITDPLTAPFSGIIRPYVSGSSIIEWSTIVAAVIYALIAWGIVSLIHLARPVTPEQVEHAV